MTESFGLCKGTKRIFDLKRFYNFKEMVLNTREYLDEYFDIQYVDDVAAVQSEEYYVKMMVAWYFATALAKQWDVVIPYIEKGRLENWTHNKAIQKAIESYRISTEQKTYLRTLKIKK